MHQGKCKKTHGWTALESRGGSCTEQQAGMGDQWSKLGTAWVGQPSISFLFAEWVHALPSVTRVYPVYQQLINMSDKPTLAVPNCRTLVEYSTFWNFANAHDSDTRQLSLWLKICHSYSLKLIGLLSAPWSIPRSCRSFKSPRRS